MKKTFFLLALTTLLLAQCRSLRPTDFHTTPPMTERMPPLRLLIHQTSFGNAFAANLSSEDCAPADSWTDYSLTAGAMMDVSYFLQNELADNVMQAGNHKFGQVRFKLLYYHRQNSGWGYTIPSIASLWTLNLLGLPVATVRSELDLQVEIADNQGKPIVTYTAPGSGKVKVAFYYGYNPLDAIRKANLDALKSALKAIETKMQQDVPIVMTKLTMSDH